MTSLRKTLLLSLLVLGCSSAVFAQNLEVIPQATNMTQVKQDVTKVSSQWGKVRDNYNSFLTGANRRSLSDQLASGIMDWNTILDYFARFVNYLSQLGIFIWACFIVYAGYIYATAVFGSWKVEKWKTAITNAILWVIIITFSYAIMKAVMAAFL